VAATALLGLLNRNTKLDTPSSGPFGSILGARSSNKAPESSNKTLAISVPFSLLSTDTAGTQ
jgi:hypothetical protein